MEDNKKYNKRRRSYTEFRSSYSDNKKNFISTDKTGKWVPFFKYFLIVVALAVVVLVGFIVTDALLEISEAPINSGESVTQTTTGTIDDKYFENQVTIPAEKADEAEENNSLE